MIGFYTDAFAEQSFKAPDEEQTAHLRACKAILYGP